jgi:hypothetical protein
MWPVRFKYCMCFFGLFVCCVCNSLPALLSVQVWFTYVYSSIISFLVSLDHRFNMMTLLQKSSLSFMLLISFLA